MTPVRMACFSSGLALQEATEKRVTPSRRLGITRRINFFLSRRGAWIRTRRRRSYHLHGSGRRAESNCRWVCSEKSAADADVGEFQTRATRAGLSNRRAPCFSAWIVLVRYLDYGRHRGLGG